MRTPMSKKMTLESLARMVQHGFEETATKKELERFATKEDLERFATKEDLERFATKEDFAELRNKIQNIENTMATKAELYDVRETLTRSINELKERMDAGSPRHRGELDRLHTWKERVEERLTALEVRRLRKS